MKNVFPFLNLQPEEKITWKSQRVLKKYMAWSYSHAIEYMSIINFTGFIQYHKPIALATNLII